MPDEFANQIKTANQAMIKEIAKKESEQNKIIYEREKLKVLPCCNEKCKNNINIVDIITLECDHKFCKTCIKTEIEAQFQAVAELITCPICNVEILWSTVQANADLNKELQYSLKKIGLENSMTCSVCKKVFLSDRPSLENKCDECGGIE